MSSTCEDILNVSGLNHRTTRGRGRLSEVDLRIEQLSVWQLQQSTELFSHVDEVNETCLSERAAWDWAHVEINLWQTADRTDLRGNPHFVISHNKLCFYEDCVHSAESTRRFLLYKYHICDGVCWTWTTAHIPHRHIFSQRWFCLFQQLFDLNHVSWFRLFILSDITSSSDWSLMMMDQSAAELLLVHLISSPVLY